MTGLIDARSITCPHCWQSIEILIDLSEPEQSYIEDCSICCRPISIRVSAAHGEILELDASASE
ncbi:MAG: CPXCG motif-containing cysteine-rich protein [Steroidobacteraceae bacterium]